MKNFLFLTYILFLVVFSIFSYAFIDPNLFYLNKLYSGFAFTNRTLVSEIYILFIILFFIFYTYFIWMNYKNQFKFTDLKMLIIVTSAILFFSYPAMLSYDIFNYIASAKVLFFYHENPYIMMPIDFTGDPLLLFTHAANKLALYGPIWVAFTKVPYSLGLGNFIFTLFEFKLFVLAFYIGTVMLIWKITKNLFFTSLFSLNPLIIIETLVGGHNDIVMMFLALFSFFLLMKKKIFWAVVFLTMSLLIKYSTIFLIPVFAYAVWRIIKKKEVNWEKIFAYASLSMVVIFFLSFVREEIYPWYAIWFLIFAFLIHLKKIILYAIVAFCLGLLLRYVPFMATGNYFGTTPVIKISLTFLPLLILFVYLFFKGKLWLKR